MITVMGATGNTGRKITELLLEAGEEVRALVRSPEKLAKLDALGAKTVAGDVSDTPALPSRLTVTADILDRQLGATTGLMQRSKQGTWL